MPVDKVGTDLDHMDVAITPTQIQQAPLPNLPHDGKNEERHQNLQLQNSGRKSEPGTRLCSVGTIQYTRGVLNHPNRGTDPDIQRAISLIRRTNTRRPPDRISSSDEAEQQADNEGPCHEFSTTRPTESEDKPK